MKTKLAHLAFALALGACVAPFAAAESVPVTVDNFVRAESDLYFTAAFRDAGGLGKFLHHREVTPIDNQKVVRMNCDTIYSAVLIDLDAGPVTVTLPDAGKRFMSLLAVNEDHYVVGISYGAGAHTFTRAEAGTRYLFFAVRTLVDPNDPKDIAAVHKLQDALQVSQKATGTFEVPAWDPQSQAKVRDALLVLGSTIPSFDKAFGAKADVDPIRHLIGAAAGWGGNPDKEARYLTVTPPKNDGTTPYKLVVKDVPVDAFWSISVYNAKGYFEPNAENAYSVNNLTAKKASDGSVTVLFGGAPDATANHLPITPGWNYTVRLYRPRKEILDGSWKFPEPQPVN